MVHIPNRNPVARIHDPVGFRHVKIYVLVEGYGVRVARWKTELCDHGGRNRHWRREISVNMLDRPKEKELIADDPPSTVGEVGIQIHVGRCHARREQLRTRAEGRASEDESSLPVVIVRAGLRDCVEHRSYCVAELRCEAVRYLLNLLHVRVRDRDQSDPGAVALRVVATVDFVIDAVVKTVRVDLARNPEFRVRDAADVGLQAG